MHKLKKVEEIPTKIENSELRRIAHEIAKSSGVMFYSVGQDKKLIETPQIREWNAYLAGNNNGHNYLLASSSYVRFTKGTPLESGSHFELSRLVPELGSVHNIKELLGREYEHNPHLLRGAPDNYFISRLRINTKGNRNFDDKYSPHTLEEGLAVLEINPECSGIADDPITLGLLKHIRHLNSRQPRSPNSLRL